MLLDPNLPFEPSPNDATTKSLFRIQWAAVTTHLVDNIGSFVKRNVSYDYEMYSN